MPAPLLGRSVTVRLYPLYMEHTLLWAVDLVVFTVAYATWAVLGLPNGGWAPVPVLAIAALAHVIQMTFFLKVRFDDAGITIIRPWRRRRIEWDQVAEAKLAVAADYLRIRDAARIADDELV